MSKIYVTDRDGKEHELEAKSGESVMAILRENDMPIEAICGGSCSCATCHIYADGEWAARVGPQSEDEAELLADDAHKKDSSRLSCQIQFTDELDGFRLTLAPKSL